MTRIIDDIRSRFEQRGHVAYGESILMKEHMLKTAYFAQQKSNDKELITAALLHDLGHLLIDLPEDITRNGVDGYHETIAGDYLTPYFSKKVTDAITLHVQEKRYLCAKTPDYYHRLSQASKNTLQVQGGEMSAQEITQFEKEPHFREALQIRVFDDLGKESELEHPDLEYYLSIARSCLVHRAKTLSA